MSLKRGLEGPKGREGDTQYKSSPFNSSATGQVLPGEDKKASLGEFWLEVIGLRYSFQAVLSITGWLRQGWLPQEEAVSLGTLRQRWEEIGALSGMEKDPRGTGEGFEASLRSRIEPD